MKTKSFGLTMLSAIGVLTLSAMAFGTSASATDTPSPTPVVSTDASATADAEILSMLSTQPEVTLISQVVDSSTDSNAAEDSQEQSAFDADTKAAVLAGDTASAAQLTAAASIVTSIDAPEIAAVASDDAVAQALILGLPQK